MEKHSKHSKKTKEKMGKTRKILWKDPIYKAKAIASITGRIFSEKHRKNLTKSQMGRIPWNKGIPRSIIEKEKISETKKKRIRDGLIYIKKGKESHAWKGGLSFEPYGIEFNKKIKELIRQRDNYRCQECFRHQDELYTKSGRKYKLSIHHIDFNKINNKVNNLISLCRNCHAQTNFNRVKWTEYFTIKQQKMEELF